MYRKAECFQTINMLNKFKPTRNKMTPCTRLGPVKERGSHVVGNSLSGDQTRKGTEPEEKNNPKQQKNPFSRAS